MEAIVVANYTRLRLKLSSLIDSSKRFEHFLNLIYASATFDVGFLESTKFLIQKWIALQSVVNLQNEVIKNIYQICAIYFLSIAIYL